jgi:hypothetical protein
MPDTDIKLTLITGGGLPAIGVLVGVLFTSYVKELKEENYLLYDVNRELLKDNETLRYCVPKPGGRAVITYTSTGHPFCEMHSKK